MALKYATRTQFSSPKVTKIEVTSYVRDDRSNSKKFRYELFVEWSDETRFNLYRLYSDFYEFQSELEAMFPVQAGQISQQERTLPHLPSKKGSIFKTTTPKEMQDKMQNYVSNILGLEEFILKSSVVNSFFKLKDEYDHKLRGRGQNPSMHPLTMTAGGVAIEEFVAVADFKAKEKSNQLGFKKGDILNVLVKEGGWWFCESQGKNGWAPSTYLEQLSDVDCGSLVDQDVLPIGERNEGKYRAISAFVGSEGQHNCVPGDLFLVLERDPDGWWLALKLGVESEGELVEAWIPAAYLEALDDELEDESSEHEPEKYSVTERYTARGEDELTLEQGAIIEVLRKNQDGWWFCRQGENSGFFPAFNIQSIQESVPIVQSGESNGTANNKYARGRNVAASTTVFNKVKDFGGSIRANKRTTVRAPPPRVTNISKVNSVSSENFINLSKSIRDSITSLEIAGQEDLLSPLRNSNLTPSSEFTSLKADLQLANPAPETAAPELGHIDVSEVSKVKSEAKHKAILARNESKRNVTILMQQVEQKKRTLTSVGEQSLDSSLHAGTPLSNEYIKRQELKMESIKSQISDMNLSMMQLNTKMDHLETLLKEVLGKLDNK